MTSQAAPPPVSQQRWRRWPTRYWHELRQTLDNWLGHDGPRLAASLSLYSLLSLAPLVIISIATAAQHAVVDEVRGVMGPDGARTIQTVIEHGKSPHAGGVASMIGVAILLFGASSVFGELQSGLNKVWEAQTPTGGLWTLVKSRLVSFALVLGFGFLLLVSLLFSAALASFGRYLGDHLAIPRAGLVVINVLISFGGIFVLIGLIFRYVPDVSLRWRDVWQGALATGLLFTVGKALLGLYLGKAAVGSAYGAAGSLVVVIVWVYYFAMIFYFGAEYTRVRAAQRSERVGEPVKRVIAMERHG